MADDEDDNFEDDNFEDDGFEDDGFEDESLDDDSSEDDFRRIVWEETDEYATFEEAREALLGYLKTAEEHAKAAEELDKAATLYNRVASRYFADGDEDRGDRATRIAMDNYQKLREIDEKAEEVAAKIDRISALIARSFRTINPGRGNRRGPRGYKY